MAESLLDIAEARARVLHAAAPLAAEDVPVTEALGRVLAEQIRPVHDVPAFRNSAMDGFAVRSGKAGRRLRLVGESRAGRPAEHPLGEGEAVRISTGAALPDGADGVLQQELVEDHGAYVILTEAVEPGRNVREPGEDMRTGELALGPGRVLGPAELGVAVNAGRASVRCCSAPAGRRARHG